MKLERFQMEARLARRLKCYVTVNAGVTTAEDRRERVRAEVLKQPDAVVFKKACGRTATAADAFRLLYGEGP